jgi:FkbM family methyltransferase
LETIEPSPSIFEKLNQNIYINSADNVRAIQVAVTETPGIITLYRGPVFNTGRTSTMEDRGLTAECDVSGKLLLDILTEEERQRLRFIKIDVEGAENAVLSQILNSIDLFHENLDILVEISVPRTGTTTEVNKIFDRFANLGFQAYSILNLYDKDAYLNFRRVDQPKPIKLPLQEQQDIFFSRSYTMGK